MTSSTPLLALFATLFVAWNRLFTLTNARAFTLEFGGDLLSPRLLLFSLVSSFVLTLPLNHKIGLKAYREATGYYEELKSKRKYMKALKKDPVRTIALRDAQETVKYLDMPAWLVDAFQMFYQQSLYVLIGGTIIILTLTFILLWKIKN